MSKRRQLEIQIIDDDDEEEEEESASAATNYTGSGPFSYSKRSKSRVRTGNSRHQGMLNSDQFSHCFEYAFQCEKIRFSPPSFLSLSPDFKFMDSLRNIWKSFSDNTRASFTYLDCLWFSWYMDELYKEKVLVWIKRKHIFSKKYVFVPIVHWSHWNLLIFCNFGELLQSETQTTCMLLLDSLQIAGPRRLEPMIRNPGLS